MVNEKVVIRIYKILLNELTRTVNTAVQNIAAREKIFVINPSHQQAAPLLSGRPTAEPMDVRKLEMKM